MTNTEREYGWALRMADAFVLWRGRLEDCSDGNPLLTREYVRGCCDKVIYHLRMCESYLMAAALPEWKG